jgi:hypothetical protein
MDLRYSFHIASFFGTGQLAGASASPGGNGRAAKGIVVGTPQSGFWRRVKLEDREIVQTSAQIGVMMQKETDLEKYLGVVAGSLPVEEVPDPPYDPAADKRLHWPVKKPHPKSYRKPAFIPCPKCLRIRMDDLGRAVVVSATRDRLAYFRCKCCQHTFKLPLKQD